MKSATLIVLTVLLIAVTVTSASDTVPETPDCTGNDGKSFTDGCNTCLCGKDETAACTLVLCVGKRNPWKEVVPKH